MFDFFSSNQYVTSMAAMRVIGAVVELIGAAAMLLSGRVNDAIRINALLGLVGPIVLVLVALVGVSGMAEHISWFNLLLIFAGIFLILAGAR